VSYDHKKLDQDSILPELLEGLEEVINFLFFFGSIYVIPPSLPPQTAQVDNATIFRFS
jgi:hypothetical protein